MEMKLMGTEQTVRALETTLDFLRPLDTTNIWGGLQLATNMLDQEATENRNSAIFLLSDGHANIHPPRGNFSIFSLFLTFFLFFTNAIVFR